MSLLLLLVACQGPGTITGGPSPDAADGVFDGNGGIDSGGGFDSGGGIDSGGGLDGSGIDSAGGIDGGGGTTLSAEYPGDVGLGSDPDVIWFEDFEEGSLGAIAARYDQVRDNGGWALIADTPNGSGSALALTAGGGEDAVDLYKQLPNGEEWYVRWYARYDLGVPWHHSGMWFGGYNPPLTRPSPGAGTCPNGDDRFSVAIEPVFGSGGGLRFDYYNYWMNMRSYNGSSTFWGNSLVHQNAFTVDPDSWVCLEVHVHVNTDLGSGAGAVLEVWKNDALVESFDESGPLGYWIADKFCPEGADGSECTDYPAPADEILDLQVRTTADLELNYFWPQNYITDSATGTLAFDQMVVATRRIGCMQ